MGGKVTKNPRNFRFWLRVAFLTAVKKFFMVMRKFAQFFFQVENLRF
jgi:hypothetical protein